MVRLLYIGAERRLESVLKHAALEANCKVDVCMVGNGKFAIIHALNSKQVFDQVLIDAVLEDIKCVSVIDFLLKNEFVTRPEICVVGYHLDKKEVAELSTRNVRQVQLSYDLADIQRHFTSVFERAVHES